MSMHIEGPWLSKNGKKKGKPKFRNASEAKKSRELETSWAELQKKWAPKPVLKSAGKQVVLSPNMGTLRFTTENVPSRVTVGGDCTKKDPVKYTGTKMLGIGTMHKSNSVPVFSDEEAKSISSMRR